MRDHENFFSLNNQGVIHFVHSDSYHIYLMYEDHEDDKLYSFILDKDYTITSVLEVQTPVPVSQLVFKKWHRGSLGRSSDVVFSGCLEVINHPNEHWKFELDGAQLRLVQQVNFSEPYRFSTIACLSDIDVEEHVQKGNDLYCTGWCKENKAQVFVQVCMLTDTIVRRYTLESAHEVGVWSINLDTDCGRIYLAGQCSTVAGQDGSNSKAVFYPYFEVLNLQFFHQPLKR